MFNNNNSCSNGGNSSILSNKLLAPKSPRKNFDFKQKTLKLDLGKLQPNQSEKKNSNSSENDIDEDQQSFNEKSLTQRDKKEVFLNFQQEINNQTLEHASEQSKNEEQKVVEKLEVYDQEEFNSERESIQQQDLSERNLDGDQRTDAELLDFIPCSKEEKQSFEEEIYSAD